MIKPLKDGLIKGTDRPPKPGRYLYISAAFEIDPFESVYVVTVYRGTGTLSNSMMYRNPLDGIEHVAAGPYGGTPDCLWVPIEALQVPDLHVHDLQAVANSRKQQRSGAKNSRPTHSGKSRKKRPTV